VPKIPDVRKSPVMSRRQIFVCFFVGVLSSCAPSRRASVAPAAPSRAAVTGDSCAQGQAKRCRDEAKERTQAGDLPGAFALLKKGCSLHDDDSCFELAIVTHDGKGTAPDVAGGRKLFAETCQRDHAASCATLAALLKQAHEDQRARELRERACSLGHQRACNDIGVELVDAPSASAKDRDRGRQLFERACDSGVGSACSNLAFLLDPSDDDEEGNGRVVALLVRACEGKNPAGCREVGVRHIRGDGLAQDEVAASSEFEIACAGEDAQGCDWLAYTQENGLGRPKDTQRAIANYGKACDKSSYDGCFHLGNAYAGGRGVEKDERHARDLYETACGGGISEACHRLANLEIEGAPDGEARLDQLCKKNKMVACTALGARLAWHDSTRARGLELLRRACEKGETNACDEGLFVSDSSAKGVKKNPKTVFFFADRVCQLEQNCGKLSGLLLRGSGTKADPQRAGELAESSCGRNDAEGCLVAGKIHQQGKGVPRDAKKAYEFFARGCEQFSAEACDGQARALRKGDGVARDAARAKEIEEKARDIRDES
jgi:TPR repeat protein